MTELRIWTARHTTRVAAPPKRVYELIANIDRWPTLLEDLAAVEHQGFDGGCERVRFEKQAQGKTYNQTMVRELNPKRLQVRFRQIDVLPPVASLGGIWLVLPRGSGSLVALDHYYRVLDNSPVTAARVELAVTAESTSMLRAINQSTDNLSPMIAEAARQR
jgi:aromatase